MMKTIDLQNNVTELTIILVLISLVFSNALNSLSIGALVIFSLLLRTKGYGKVFNIFTIGSTILFVFIAVSAFLSDNQYHGFKFLERNIVLLFLPILFAVISPKKLNLELIFKGYMSLLSALLCFAMVVALYKNFNYNIDNDLPFYRFKSWFFTYHYLAANVNCTAIYLSLYVSFAIILLSLDITNKNPLGLDISKNAKYVWLTVLFSFLLLLSARTILAITTLIILLLFYRYAKEKSSLKSYFLLLVLLVAPLVLFVLNNDVLKLRIKGIFLLKENTKYFSGGLSSRIYQWEAIFNDVVNHNLLFGVGVGDVNEAYLNIYKLAELDWALNNQFNSHNMYIEIFFSMGLIGSSALLAMLFYLFKTATQSKDSRYLLFLIMFCSAGLTESLLNRQYGIVYFFLINSLFYFHHKTKAIENSYTGH